MEFVVETGIALILSLAVFGVGFVVIRKRRGGSSSIARANLLTEITSLTTELESMRKYEHSYAGPGQLQELTSRIEAIKVELTKESDTLKAIEVKLRDAQKIVEGKEGQQQEMKSVKVKDEMTLQGLMTRYNDISDESRTLEQRLAQSLKNLDTIFSEFTLTQEQRKHLSDLSETLTAAGDRLRELLTEYETVKERLDMLSAQHADLEAEYTKLVEQQLGG